MDYLLKTILVMCLVTSSPAQQADNEESPFLDLASSFLENLSSNGNNGNQDLFSTIGNLVAGAASGSGKNSAGGGNAEMLLSIGQALFAGQAAQGGGGGFNPMMIASMIQQFMPSDNNDEGRQSGGGNQDMMGTILNVASMFMSQQQGGGGARKARSIDESDNSGNGNVLMDLLPLAVQAINSFSQPEEVKKTEKSHQDHAGILPPFLEKIHIFWDQFSNSDLSNMIFKQIGLDKLFVGFVGRDQKVDYDKLFQSFQNQNFRRKWIKKAIVYVADWAKYLSNAEVYKNYLATGQTMANAFLQSQGFPQRSHINLERPSESLTNMINFGARKYINTDVDSSLVVTPIIKWFEKVSKLGSKDFLKNLNTTEVSNSLTDTFNLEVIEPIAKVHRAYRYAVKHPKCDKYVICEVNSHDKGEKLELGNFKPSIIRFGSYAASWFISGKTHTSFWTLFAIANEPKDCKNVFYPTCSEFNDVENSVSSEYVHTEL